MKAVALNGFREASVDAIDDPRIEYPADATIWRGARRSLILSHRLLLDQVPDTYRHFDARHAA